MAEFRLNNLIGDDVNPGIEQFVDMENKKASFDSPEFKSLLTQAKAIIDDGVVAGTFEEMVNSDKGLGMGLFEGGGSVTWKISLGDRLK